MSELIHETHVITMLQCISVVAIDDIQGVLRVLHNSINVIHTHNLDSALGSHAPQGRYIKGRNGHRETISHGDVM